MSVSIASICHQLGVVVENINSPNAPFVTVSIGGLSIPIWLECWHSGIWKCSAINDNAVHYLRDSIAFGKPLPNQTLADWGMLVLDKCGHHKCNAIGLFEFMDQLPDMPGDVKVFVTPDGRFGVWSDSRMAAKTFCGYALRAHGNS